MKKIIMFILISLVIIFSGFMIMANYYHCTSWTGGEGENDWIGYLADKSTFVCN